jgi:hypothetical protein
MYHYTHLEDGNMSNGFVALFSSIPAAFALFVEQSAMNLFLAALLPFMFFVLGKLIDLLIKLWLEARDAAKNSNDRNGNTDQ